MPVADVERAIISKVRGLFDSRGISQRELADAIGTSPSWVSAFFAQRRPANDIHLLQRIARYFGVSVGYLLHETERGRDAESATLLAAFAELQPPDRDVVLNVALSLLRRRGETAAGEAPAGAMSAVQAGGGRIGAGRKPLHATKGRSQ